MDREFPRWKTLCSLLLVAYGLCAQESGDLLTKLRKLQLREKPGAVLLLYSPAAEQRALGYEKSLAAAHAWYERQLQIQLPLNCLAVLDREAWGKYSPGSPYPFLPSAVPAQRVITVSADMDKLPGQRPAALPLEAAIFHEDGHILAHALKIAGRSFTNEFFANLSSAAYILSGRPDLSFVLDGPRAEEWPTPPRYTSLEDI
jgi:hypothetical protein